MTTKMKTAGALLLALAGWLGAGSAQAANPAYLNISVAVTANVSVSVNDAASSTMTTTWDAANPNQLRTPTALATATVTNDSSGVLEKWKLSTNAYTLSPVSGSTWTIVGSTTSVGLDEVAVQAVFGSSNTASCPAAGSSDWDSTFAPVLTTSLATYSAATFAAPSLTNDGTQNPDYTSGVLSGRMLAGSKRALCWRIKTPSATSTNETQNVQVIVTASLL